MEDENILNINTISKSENLRLYVLEHTILIEEQVSSALGKILSIDWRDSKSFGFGSSSLSFNQKVQIIQDIQGLEKIEIQKLSDIMSIRNKFAHVKSIETFKDFFQSGENGKNVKNNFDKWYGEFSLETEDEEVKYKRFFFLLAAEVILIISLRIIFHEHIENTKQKEIKQDKINLEFLVTELRKIPGGNFILSKAYDQTLKKLKEEEQ
jgi:hypothetical protein